MTKAEETLNKIKGILQADGMELKVNPTYNIIVQEIPQQAPKVEEPKITDVETKNV